MTTMIATLTSDNTEAEIHSDAADLNAEFSTANALEAVLDHARTAAAQNGQPVELTVLREDEHTDLVVQPNGFVQRRVDVREPAPLGPASRSVDLRRAAARIPRPGRNVVLVGIGIAVTVTAISVSRLGDPDTTTANQPAAATLAPQGSVTSDTSTGPGVIAAFDRAYYVSPRTAEAALAFWIPEAAAAAPQMRAELARLDPRVRHQVEVTATGDPLVYDAKLTLTGPDQKSKVFYQRFELVRQTDGTYRIANLTCTRGCS